LREKKAQGIANHGHRKSAGHRPGERSRYFGSLDRVAKMYTEFRMSAAGL
jgi:hypothetical protein